MTSAPARSPAGSLRPDSSKPQPEAVVDIWHGALDVPAHQFDRLFDSLTLDEVERAFRFKFDLDRMRWIVARGTLRALLGSYLGLPPAAVPLSYGAFGKPEVDRGLGSDLHFNLSHSGGMALFAIARGRRVGVDLEQLARPLDTTGIAAMTLTPREQRRLDATSASDRTTAFYRLWTQKEAVVKAGGEGLTREMRSFEIRKQRGALVADKSTARAVWRLYDLPVPQGFVASLAAEGDAVPVRSRCVSDEDV